MSKGWLAGATPADRVTRAGSQGSRRDKPVLSCQRPPRRPTSPILRHISRNPNVSVLEAPPSSYLAGPFTVPSSPVSRSCLDPAPCREALFSAHRACKNMSKGSRLHWIKPADACMLEPCTLTGCRASARERILKKASLYPKPVCQSKTLIACRDILYMERVSGIAKTEEHFTASTTTLAQNGYAPSDYKFRTLYQKQMNTGRSPR